MNSFSPNMLKIFEQCPEKYYFKYAKNLSMPSNDEIFETGKNIHALASYYLRGENIDRFEKSLTEQELELWLYLKNIEYFKYKYLKTEYNLTFKLGEYFFGGRLDALVKKEDVYYILDYKTGTPPKNATYDYQTMIYILAVNELFNTKNIKFVYIDLKNKKNIEVEFNDGLKSEYINKLTEIADKISKEYFQPSKKSCKMCEYGKICYDKVLD